MLFSQEHLKFELFFTVAMQAINVVLEHGNKGFFSRNSGNKRFFSGKYWVYKVFSQGKSGHEIFFFRKK
jgi:hypothetical protein